MNTETFDAYRRAGKIGKEVREWSRSLVKPRANILEIAEKIENKIKEKGADMAFPTNICINEITAHYTPKHNEML